MAKKAGPKRTKPRGHRKNILRADRTRVCSVAYFGRSSIAIIGNAPRPDHAAFVAPMITPEEIFQATVTASDQLSGPITTAMSG